MVKGFEHKGTGEMTGIEHLYREHFAIFYNIDGCSQVYDAKFNEDEHSIKIKHMVVGDLPLESGKLEHLDYNKEMDIFTVSFSTAISSWRANSRSA